MKDEVARCIAEGMAEVTLDALEKKVKEQMGDTPVHEKIAGLGDPIVIEIPDAVEAAKNFDPYPPLDQRRDFVKRNLVQTQMRKIEQDEVHRLVALEDKRRQDGNKTKTKDRHAD